MSHVNETNLPLLFCFLHLMISLVFNFFHLFYSLVIVCLGSEKTWLDSVIENCLVVFKKTLQCRVKCSLHKSSRTQ